MTVQKMKTSILRLSVAMAATAVVLSSCMKSVDPPAPTPPKAYVSILHLAPTAPSLDVFFNEVKVSGTPFAPGNVTSIYNAVEKGAFSVKFKKAASDSLVAEAPMAQYDSLNFYTLFIHNELANGPAKVVRIKDNFSNLTNTKPYYRFFHASPNTGAVDLYINNAKIESNRTLADNAGHDLLNEFVETTPGFHTIQVKLAGTETVVATLSNAELLSGNAYTFYLRGLEGGAGNSQLSIGILRAIN